MRLLSAFLVAALFAAGAIVGAQDGGQNPTATPKSSISMPPSVGMSPTFALTEPQRLELRVSQLEEALASTQYTIGQLQAQLGAALGKLAEYDRAAAQGTLQKDRDALIAKWREQLHAPKDAEFDGTAMVFKPAKAPKEKPH